MKSIALLSVLALMQLAMAGCVEDNSSDSRTVLPQGKIITSGEPEGQSVQVTRWVPCECEHRGPDGVHRASDYLTVEQDATERTLVLIHGSNEPLGWLSASGRVGWFMGGFAVLSQVPWLVPSILEATGQSTNGPIEFMGLHGERHGSADEFSLEFTFAFEGSEGLTESVIEYTFDGVEIDLVPASVTMVIGDEQKFLWSNGRGVIEVEGIHEPADGRFMEPVAASGIQPPTTDSMAFNLADAIKIARQREPVVNEFAEGDGTRVISATRTITNQMTTGQEISRQWQVMMADSENSLEFSVAEEVVLSDVFDADALYTVAVNQKQTSSVQAKIANLPMVTLDEAFAACVEYLGGQPKYFVFNDELTPTLWLGGQVVSFGMFSYYACDLFPLSGMVIDSYTGQLLHEPPSVP